MLRAFVINDDDLYAANDQAEAIRLYREGAVSDDEPEPDVVELSAEELDRRQPLFDENEHPIDGETTSVREMLIEHGDEPGWLAATRW